MGRGREFALLEMCRSKRQSRKMKPNKRQGKGMKSRNGDKHLNHIKNTLHNILMYIKIARSE
jgi:hypothetical protein